MPDIPADPAADLLKKYEMAEEAPAEAADTPAPETPTPVAVEKPKHSIFHTRLAKRAGLDDAEIAELSKDDLLEAIALSNDRREQVKSDQRLNAAGQPIDENGRFLPRGEPAPVAPQQGSKDEPFDLAKALGVDVSKWDDKTTPQEMFNSVLAPLWKELQAVKASGQRIDALEGRERGRTKYELGVRLDRLFSDNEKLFGKGPVQKLRDETQAMRRNLVVQAMDANFKADPSLSFEENFEKAAKVFGSLVVEAPVVKEVKDPHGFANGHTTLPVNRMTKRAPKGVKAAEEAVEKFQHEMEAAEPSTEHEDLPA